MARSNSLYVLIELRPGLGSGNRLREIPWMTMKSAHQAIHRLNKLRSCFGKAYPTEKTVLLEELPGLAVRTAADLRSLHQTLCFMRAFPDSRDIYDKAVALLADFPLIVSRLSDVQRTRLGDSGIAGTDIHYRFSFEVATWLSGHYPGIATIDWQELEDSTRMDELLEQLLEGTELDYFDSGRVSTEEWFGIAVKKGSATDFDWLLSQMGERQRYARFWASLYNAADIPVRCQLAESSLSKSANVMKPKSVFYRKSGMRRKVVNARNEITRPLDRITRVSNSRGKHYIDIAMSSLTVRHRETIHFNYSNPDEVYVADVGTGINIVVTGLQADHRYPLECTMGFLILSNGAPIGYGGTSILFRQANTGINIFDEYRGSEAAWLWVQVMRVFHSLTGCNRFIANAFQFGSENTEALKSGAFWFYYHLGYRPVDQDVRQLARAESRRLRFDKGRRTPTDILKCLAKCDMHLTLPGARTSDWFDEDWIETCGLLTTRELAKTDVRSRSASHRKLAGRLASELRIHSMAKWSAQERSWFTRLCPVVAATNPGKWPAAEQMTLVSLMRAKGGKSELDFARRFGRHQAFFKALKSACKRSD